MKKLRFITLPFLISLFSAFFFAIPASAGTGGTTVTEVYRTFNTITVDVESTIITTKAYTFSIPSSSIERAELGVFELPIYVTSVSNTYPYNAESKIKSRITLLYPSEGKNTLRIKIISNGSSTRGQLMYNAQLHYWYYSRNTSVAIGNNDLVFLLNNTYDFNFARSGTIIEPNPSDPRAIPEEDPRDTVEEVIVEPTQNPDLTASVDRIDLVKIKVGKNWVKKYKVTVRVTNDGSDDAEGPIMFSYQGPLVPSNEGKIAESYRAPAAVTKTIRNTSLAVGQAVTGVFYVDTKYRGLPFVITADPKNLVNEYDEDNNSYGTSILPFKI